MDKQNSKGRASRLRSTRAILHYASELKVDIQSQVYELIAALKKREHELCMQVDRQCLEQLCEAEECGAYYEPQIDESYCMEDDDPNENCYFTTRLEFHSDFKNSKHLLQNYGQLKKFNCSNNIACLPKIDKCQLPEEQIDTEKNIHLVDDIDSFKEISRKKCEDPAESFEFVDSVECLSSEKIGGKCQKNVRESLAKKKEDPEEVLEKVSCCSVDSFDVIQTDCCGVMNDLISDAVQTELPSTLLIKPVNQARCNKNSGYPTFYLPNLQKREQKDNDWIARIVRHLPKEKSPLKDPVSTVKEAADAEVLPTYSEANITTAEGIICNKPGKQSIGQEAGDKPANKLHASFKAYLQKDDLKAWIHPNRKSVESQYEQWVVRDASSCISNAAGMSDAVINAFCRQLKSFAV